MDHITWTHTDEAGRAFYSTLPDTRHALVLTSCILLRLRFLVIPKPASSSTNPRPAATGSGRAAQASGASKGRLIYIYKAGACGGRWEPHDKQVGRGGERDLCTSVQAGYSGRDTGRRRARGTGNLGIKCQRKSRYREVEADEKGRSGGTGGNHIDQDHLFQFGET